MGFLNHILESAWSAIAWAQVPQGVAEPGAAAAAGAGLLMALAWVAGICLLSVLIVMIPTVFRRRQPGH